VIGDDVRNQFPGAAGYFNTASLGLPSLDTVDALHGAIADWQSGRVEPPDYDDHVATARELFAGLVSAPVDWVAIGSQVSALVGVVATALRPGSRVLCPEGEFTSVFFPFLARADLDVTVEFVPLEHLADSIGSETDLVAFSAVQSSNGKVADLDAIKAAAAANGALTLVDATQAVGWLPIDATSFDFMVAGAYKWMVSPRGTAFMTVHPELLDRTTALYAGWYAGELPWESIYGPPLRLASNARRFDLSPGWLPWVGTASALRLLDEVGIGAIHAHDVGLANSFRTQLGMEPSNSAIVSLDLPSGFDGDRLEGLRVAYRAGRLRVGFHLYNTDDDVDLLVAAVNG